ncbi:MAG TPA: 4Fe-4S dicluster domain-containing protein [Candidatus Hydrogenedentes bacterium]|nr:4Fe-4S dicluster domain-containing protein [Candidatus Hydrogenedentota bacterium]
MQYIAEGNSVELLRRISGTYEVYAPRKNARGYSLERWNSSAAPITMGGARMSEPLKAFFFQPRQLVAENFSPNIPPLSGKPRCIVGVKACDLAGLEFLDRVFNAPEDRDPFYARVREQTLIIAADCTAALDTCFCLALGIDPFPKKNFDIALSPVNGGYLVETGSEKGRDIVTSHSNLFTEPDEAVLSKREEQRARVKRDAASRIDECGVPSVTSSEQWIARHYESELWKEEAKPCVECGACNTICPTCHCFLLYDQMQGGQLARYRTWDSCLYKDFARVAGGGNPRHVLWMRLRNRFEKKFDYAPKVLGQTGCTGCGRCVAACPGKIDIRNVLKRLATHG